MTMPYREEISSIDQLSPANEDIRSQLEKLRKSKNPTLQRIAVDFEEKYEKDLHELKMNWNQKIRSYYRDKLSLNTKNHPLNISWRLDSDEMFGGHSGKLRKRLPSCVVCIVEKLYTDFDFDRQHALLRYISETERVESHFKMRTSKEALRESRECAKKELQEDELKEIIKILFVFDRPDREPTVSEAIFDVLGAYYLEGHTIEIYIVPCILFAMLIGANFLDVAIFVLAHELAHGFHHIGADKDGFTWGNKFRRVRLELAEGLAQFYAQEFSRSIKDSRPSVLEAFENGSARLPEYYKHYKKWDMEHELEVVYQAFIEGRRNDIRTCEEFEHNMEQAKNRLKTG